MSTQGSVQFTVAKLGVEDLLIGNTVVSQTRGGTAVNRTPLGLLNYRGAYVAANSYKNRDLVLSAGTLYLCIADVAGSDSIPLTNTTRWNVFAKTTEALKTANTPVVHTAWTAIVGDWTIPADSILVDIETRLNSGTRQYRAAHKPL